VFFTEAGIPWEYEPQGFVIDKRPYLPDFYLPECGTWIEVKGQPQHSDEINFLNRASAQLPRSKFDGCEWGPALMLVGPIPALINTPWGEAREIGWNSFPSFTGYGFGLYPKNRRPWFLTYWLSDRNLHVFEWDEFMKPEIANAYRAARSARFEHGEQG
jgi:hypothetical protein